MWQEIIVGLCVLAALIFIVRRLLKKNNSCSGCSGCGKASRCGARNEGAIKY